ncbi:partial Tyrosine recombinase XerC, partial [Anaerolineae bacterium]
MPDVIKQFEDWLRNDQDRGELTVKAYLADVHGFVTWWQQTHGDRRFDLVAVTPTDIRDYRSRLTVVGRQKTNSVNRRLAALRTFYKWAMLHDMVRRSPLAGLKMDRQQKAAPRWLEPRAEYYLQQAMEQRLQLLPPDETLTPTDRLIIRDAALIALMWKAGLRVSEVAALDVVDLKIQSSQRGVAIVRLGKGRKSREVPLNAGTIAALRHWLKIRATSDHQPALFTSKTGRRLAPRAIQAVVEQIGREAASKVPARGSDEREIIDALNALTPHVLRHTSGKRLLDAGAQLTEVAEILGHEDLNVTRRYTQPSKADLQRA